MKLSENLLNLLQDYTFVPLPLGILVEQSLKQGFGIISGFLTLPMLMSLQIPLFCHFPRTYPTNMIL